MITTKQRAHLRALAATYPDVVYIGKDGIEPAILQQIRNNLLARELIKVKVHKTSSLPIVELAEQLALATQSEVVATVGSKIILYQFSTKQNFKHLL